MIVIKAYSWEYRSPETIIDRFLGRCALNIFFNYMAQKHFKRPTMSSTQREQVHQAYTRQIFRMLYGTLGNNDACHEGDRQGAVARKGKNTISLLAPPGANRKEIKSYSKRVTHSARFL